MTPIVWTLLILLAAVIAFITNRVPVAAVTIGVAIALWATGVLDVEQAFAGFGDPTVMFIAALFVVSASLESTGVTAWAGQQMLKRGISGRSRLLVVVAVLVAVLTALISVNGAVAAILPVAVVVSLRSGIEPSKVLMPLAFFAHAGSLLLLTGTPLNILVTDAAVEAGDRGFNFFEFALAGLPLLAGSILIIVLFGDRLLPSRPATVMTRDLSTHVNALRKQYDLGVETELIGAESGVLEVVLPPRSELIGEHPEGRSRPMRPRCLPVACAVKQRSASLPRATQRPVRLVPPTGRRAWRGWSCQSLAASPGLKKWAHPNGCAHA